MRSKISLFFFVIIYNYIFMRVIIFPYFYSNLKSNIFGITIMIITVALFFSLYFISTKTELIKKSWIKYFFSFCLILRSILGTAIGVILLKKIFFFDYYFALIAIGLVIGIIALSFLAPKEIVEFSTPFGIIVVISYFIYLFTTFEFFTNDFTFSFSSNIIIYLLIILYLIDNFILGFVVKDKKDKHAIVYGSIISLLMFTLEYVVLVSSSGVNLFTNDYFSGFIALAVSGGSKIDFNFRYIYIVMITITVAFKFSFFLSLARELFSFKKKKFACILFPICLGLVIGTFFIYLYDIMWIYYLILFTFLGIILLWVAGHVKRV